MFFLFYMNFRLNHVHSSYYNVTLLHYLHALLLINIIIYYIYIIVEFKSINLVDIK